jgi:hypothetical protein
MIQEAIHLYGQKIEKIMVRLKKLLPTTREIKRFVFCYAYL